SRSRSRSSDRERSRHSRSSSTSSSESSGRSSSRSPSPDPPEEGELDRQGPVPGVDYQSPLLGLPRIPRRDEFASAQEEIPAPPAVPQRTQRIRISLTEEARRRFDQVAAGMQMSSSERIAILKDVPLVSSPFAEVAMLDDQLPREVERSIQLRETDLRGLNETLINTINIIELVRKLGADGAGTEFHPSVIGYFDIATTLLSASLRDIIVFRRERVLRSLGLDPYKAMPSYRRLPLAGTTVVHRMSQAVHPELFGRELRDELAAGESALLKSVQKLRAQRSRRRDRPDTRKRRSHTQPSTSRAENASTSSVRDKTQDRLRAKKLFKNEKRKEK
ncbi:unnamed protein product, partial [Cylicocyclus nassatus]